MLKSFFCLCAVALLVSGCIATRLDQVSNNQGYLVSSESLSFDITDEGVLDMKNWLATDKTPYTATVKYGKLSNKTLRSVLKVLESHKIKYSLEKGAGENKIVLYTSALKAKDCKGFGCNSSSNLVHMLSNKEQVISPKVLKDHYSFTFN